MYMNGLKRKVCVAVLCVFAAAAVLYAHTPLLTVEDNGDGTIFVQGGFSNGASAGGVKLYLKDAATGEKLYDGVFPDIGETNLDIPSVPYTVTFDAGPGHIVVKDGPPPPGGFGAAKADKAAKTIRLAKNKNLLIFTFLTACLIYFSDSSILSKELIL